MNNLPKELVAYILRRELGPKRPVTLAKVTK